MSNVAMMRTLADTRETQTQMSTGCADGTTPRRTENLMTTIGIGTRTDMHPLFNIRLFRVGGIRFLKLDRLNVSFSVSRQPQEQ